MNSAEPGFKICNQKGFHVTFANGWTVSVQFGRGNYCDNYDAVGSWGDPVPPSRTAEIAAWPSGGDMIVIDDGDTVRGYVSPDELLAFMAEIAAKTEEKTNA